LRDEVKDKFPVEERQLAFIQSPQCFYGSGVGQSVDGKFQMAWLPDLRQVMKQVKLEKPEDDIVKNL
jgi:hypothetical protein